MKFLHKPNVFSTWNTLSRCNGYICLSSTSLNVSFDQNRKSIEDQLFSKPIQKQFQGAESLQRTVARHQQRLKAIQVYFLLNWGWQLGLQSIQNKKVEKSKLFKPFFLSSAGILLNKKCACVPWPLSIKLWDSYLQNKNKMKGIIFWQQHKNLISTLFLKLSKMSHFLQLIFFIIFQFFLFFPIVFPFFFSKMPKVLILMH